MMGAKDRVRQVLDKVTPGQALTRLPGPRVLIEDPGYFYADRSGQGRTYVLGGFDPYALAERLRATVPTVEIAESLRDFNLNEWDCLVTDTPPTTLEQTQEEQQTRYDEPKTLYSWSQRYPRTLSVICAIKSGDFDILDARPTEATARRTLPDMVVVRDPEKVGGHIRQVDGLPERIASLVSRELLPTARNRQRHPSFRRWLADGVDPDQEANLLLRPFLLGPDDVVLAGSYDRNEHASVWLLPADVPDLFPWVVEALREWHLLYPDRFPLVPDWHTADDWRSATEAAIAQEREDLTEAFEAQVQEYQRQLRALDERGESARAAADAYQRALLTEDGDQLVDAVACALAALGFHVVDMDEHWPHGDRREDLRVFDDDDPEWVAIVEVKGAKGGAKETEVQNFGRWAQRFILDEKRAPDGQWFVTNHQRGLDPSARQPPFANKPAVVTTFAKSDGTVIDTRALFDLVGLIETDPSLGPAARGLLKAKPPVLARVSVDDLVEVKGEPDSGAGSGHGGIGTGDTHGLFRGGA